MFANNFNVACYQDYLYAITFPTVKLLSKVNPELLRGANSCTLCSHHTQMLSGLLSGGSAAIMSSDND